MPNRGSSTRSLVETVDALLLADKTLAGEPSWAKGNRDGDFRLSMPVVIGDEMPGVTLQVTAYPNEPSLRFTITLNLPPCIWRLDFDPDTEVHHNPLDWPAQLGGYRVRGPHFHAWEDSRHLTTAATLPDLRYARAFPSNIKTFDSALRWFCGRTKIRLSGQQRITLPPRTVLI